MHKKVLELEKIENQGKKFFYRDFGWELHGRNSFRLWVPKKFTKVVSSDKEAKELRIEKGKFYFELPLLGAKIVDGKSEKTKIIKSDSNYWIAAFFVDCGYRGGSSFEVPEGVQVTPFEVWASERGSLGIAKGGLLTIPISMNKVSISWERTGRLYGDPPTGITEIYQDGKEVKLDNIDIEDLELLEG